MIRTGKVLFCDNEHGIGNVTKQSTYKETNTMRHITLSDKQVYLKSIGYSGPAITIETKQATIVIEQGKGKTMYYVVDKSTGKQSEIYAVIDPDENVPQYCEGCTRIIKSWYDHRKECPLA